MDWNVFHEQVQLAVAEVRRRFNEIEAPEFRLDIECSGRVEGGQPRLAYRLNAGGYTSDMPTGSRLDAAIEEAVRRYQWNRRNDPLALPAPEF